MLPWILRAFPGRALPACVLGVRAEVLLLSLGGVRRTRHGRAGAGVGVRTRTKRGLWSSRELGNALKREQRRWASMGAQHSGEDKASGQTG